MSDVVVRGFSLLLALIPVGIHVWLLVQSWGTKHGELFSPLFYASLFGMAFLGIPGIYVAVKGIDRGEESSKNRRKGAKLAVSGVFIACCGLLGDWIARSMSGQTGVYVFILYGALGFGALQFSIGFFSMMSGRDLIKEWGGE